MISHDKLTFEIFDCDSEEQEILDKFWDCNEKGEFTISLVNLRNDYGLNPTKLYALAESKSKLTIDFGYCECGQHILDRITTRKDFTWYLKNDESFIRKHSKCISCREIEENAKHERRMALNEEFMRNLYASNTFDYEESYRTIQETISSLPTHELRLLKQMYQLKDFNLIKKNNEIIPNKGSSSYKATWASIFKFDNLGLIKAHKGVTDSYIINISFNHEVEEALNNQMIKEDSSSEEIIELALINSNDTGKPRFVNSFKLEKDIVLKAGSTFEFTARTLSDGNIILRVTEVETEQNGSSFPQSAFLSSFDDEPPF